MRPPSLAECNALRRALLKETDDPDNPAQALRLHRALAQAAIAVLPHVESPAVGPGPVYLVLWAQSRELSVFMTTSTGDVVRVKTISLLDHASTAPRE